MALMSCGLKCAKILSVDCAQEDMVNVDFLMPKRGYCLILRLLRRPFSRILNLNMALFRILILSKAGLTRTKTIFTITITIKISIKIKCTVCHLSE